MTTRRLFQQPAEGARGLPSRLVVVTGAGQIDLCGPGKRCLSEWRGLVYANSEDIRFQTASGPRSRPIEPERNKPKGAGVF
jgi:hypothetical protein